MQRLRLSVSAGALLLLAALYFFDTSGVFSAMLPAVIAHELGHALAILSRGGRVKRLRLGFAGLSMDYSGALSRASFLLCALAGPVSGAIFSLLLSIAGKALKSEYLLCVSGVSAVLSIFNILPAPMLDGGRALGIFLPKRVLLLSGLVTGAGLLSAGLYCAYKGLGFALISAGAWTVVCTCQTRTADI